jgi:arabinogalactan oligomer/maltooligosaccharide transport system permease protein
VSGIRARTVSSRVAVGRTHATHRAACFAALAALVATLALPVVAHAQQTRRTVRVWHAYDEAEARALGAVMRAFEASSYGRAYRVEALHVAFGAYAAKLESAIPTGEGPDLFIDAHERIVSYVARGLVQPLGGLGVRELVDFDTAHLDALRVERALYGLPLALKCGALYVNEALLPADPETLEDLAALRARLPPGAYPLVFEAESAYWDASLLHAYGGRLLDAEGNYAFTGPEAARTLAHLRRLVDGGVVPAEASGDLVKKLFVSGRAAAVIGGPWLAPDLPATMRWHVAPLPRVRSAGGAPLVPFVTIEAALLAARARESEGARAFARFLAGPEGASLRSRVARQVVASRTAAMAPAVAGDPFLAAFRRAAESGIPLPSHPRMRATFEPAQRAIRNYLRGGRDADDVLAEGARRFADLVRPLPAERSPAPLVLAVSLVLLLAVAFAVRRARDPDFRVAVRRSLPAYAWVAHAVVVVTLLVVAPLVVGAGTSLFAGAPGALHYVGLANYVDVLTARGGALLGTGSFWVVLLVTVLWTAVNVALHLLFGVGLALLLDRPTLRLRGLYRVLLVLPWAVPSYVTALAWKGMFHRQFGAVNAVITALGGEPISWFARWSTAFAANVATNVWLGFPFMMVVTLGALAAIPQDLYEAAEVDGATAAQRFRLVTWPLLAPSLGPAIAMGAVWTFNMFNVVFLVSGGEPDGGTEILVSEAYRWAFTRSQQLGYAAAYAVLIFGVLVLGTRALGRLGGKEGAR